MVVLLLWILFVIYVSCLSLLCCLVCSLQPSGHLLGKGWPLGSLVCDVFLCFCYFPISCFESRPGVIKLFSYSTQLSMKFILLITVKMPTIVGILTFISRIRTSSERLKAWNNYIFQHLSFYEQLKFHAQLRWAWKKFYYLRAGVVLDCIDSWSLPSLILISWLNYCVVRYLCTNQYFPQRGVPGRVGQLVMCLATDARRTADPGVASSIPARSHNFVEIDHEIISTVILLPSAEPLKKGCCQLQAKVCAWSTG